MGCFSAIIFIVVILGIVGYAAYTSLTAELLPRLESIRGRTTFETSRLLDRNGAVLYEFFGTGRRTKVGLASVSKDLLNGTISIEDKTFYSNPGVDYIGIARAAYYSATAGEVVGGGSTISQQVIKQVVLTEKERSNDIESRLRRKVVEVVLAQEISRQYSKDDILELYVNEIYYGNLAYGIEAAAKGIEMCLKNLREKFPAATIIVAKILPAQTPGNRFYEDVKKTNAALDPLKLDSDPNVKVLDLWPDFTNADGTIKKDLFTPDNIHLSPAGYEVYAERLKPLLALN